jgi:hypothetical protein
MTGSIFLQTIESDENLGKIKVSGLGFKESG